MLCTNRKRTQGQIVRNDTIRPPYENAPNAWTPILVLLIYETACRQCNSRLNALSTVGSRDRGEQQTMAPGRLGSCDYVHPPPQPPAEQYNSATSDTPLA